MLSAEDALFIRVYPASSPLNLSHSVIGMTGITDRYDRIQRSTCNGITDRHETESLIGMARIMQLEVITTLRRS
jgi:hypothetical protein